MIPIRAAARTTHSQISTWDISPGVRWTAIPGKQTPAQGIGAFKFETNSAPSTVHEMQLSPADRAPLVWLIMDRIAQRELRHYRIRRHQ
jgi:hypothetical protein